MVKAIEYLQVGDVTPSKSTSTAEKYRPVLLGMAKQGAAAAAFYLTLSELNACDPQKQEETQSCAGSPRSHMDQICNNEVGMAQCTTPAPGASAFATASPLATRGMPHCLDEDCWLLSKPPAPPHSSRGWCTCVQEQMHAVPCDE
jgi:hypothetical protein